MSNEERIKIIEDFVQTQRYLDGRKFRVIEDPDMADGFIIELDKASKRQINTLNHRLRINETHHIRARALEIVKFEPNNFKNIKRNKNGNNDGSKV